MRLIKRIIPILTVLFILASSSLLFAQEKTSFPSQGLNYSELYKELNLTNDQQAKMEEIQKNHGQETKKLRDEYCSLQNEIKKLWSVKSPDLEKIKDRMHTATDLKIKIKEGHFNMAKEMEKILTKGQLKKLQENKKNIFDRKQKKQKTEK